MRLPCTVAVSYDDGISNSNRALTSTLALVCDPINLVCIIHFSSTNKLGKKYKVISNIVKVFTRFCGEGKATISFKNPPHSLAIQADPVQLKAFLILLKQCLMCKKHSDLPALSSVSVTPVGAAPTKLIVLDVASLPAKGFPRTLKHLQISGLSMHNFKRDILLLRSLVVLDLSNNCLEKIPEDLGDMPNLCQLILNNNNLGSSNHSWAWTKRLNISKTLLILDLSKNSLKFIPFTLGRLKKLSTLKLDNNELTRLPNAIGRLQNLVCLSASNNKIGALSVVIDWLNLDQLDLSHNVPNKTIQPVYPPPRAVHKVNTLLETAATIVLMKEMHYASDIIPFTLVDYLDNCNYCKCRRPSFESTEYKISIPLYLRSITKTYYVRPDHTIYSEYYMCTRCLAKPRKRKYEDLN